MKNGKGRAGQHRVRQGKRRQDRIGQGNEGSAEQGSTGQYRAMQDSVGRTREGSRGQEEERSTAYGAAVEFNTVDRVNIFEVNEQG